MEITCITASRHGTDLFNFIMGSLYWKHGICILKRSISCRCLFFDIQWNATVINLFYGSYRTGLILALDPANERRLYRVTAYLTGWAQTKNQPCSMPIKYRYVICYVVVIIWLWNWSFRYIQPYFQSCFIDIGAIVGFVGTCEIRKSRHYVDGICRYKITDIRIL